MGMIYDLLLCVSVEEVWHREVLQVWGERYHCPGVLLVVSPYEHSARQILSATAAQRQTGHGGQHTQQHLPTPCEHTAAAGRMLSKLEASYNKAAAKIKGES